MSSSGSDETGVTDDVRVRMLEEENIKLKAQILTLQEQFTQLSKINFEQTTRNMSLRIMIKKVKTKNKLPFEEIPNVENESENRGTAEETCTDVEVVDGTSGDEGKFVTDKWKQDNCLEGDMFVKIKGNEEVLEDTNGMKVPSKIENLSGDDRERNKLLEYIGKVDGNPRLYRCVVCGKTNTNKYRMKNHVENIHFPEMFSYPCKFCGKILSTKQSFLKHKNLHKTTKVPDQPEEEKERSASILPDNIEIVDTDSNVLIFRCKVCGKTSAQKSNLIKHIEVLHFPGSFMYWCKICFKNFDTRPSLYRHMNSNHRETIKVRARNDKIDEREEFIRKDVTNTSVPIFRCNMCGFTNIRRDKVRNHVERKHCLRNP